MKTSKISQLLIVFYFIALTGCSVDDRSDNGVAYVEKCWTIIDVNTGVPITTAYLKITYISQSGFGGYGGRHMETDEEGKACGSFRGGQPLSIRSGSAWAPNYFATIFDSIIPDVIKLTPFPE